MHSLICGLITATMVLLPWKDGGGSVKAWMERYEAFLYQQMAENFEREKRERNAEICQNPSESEVSIEQTASEEETAESDKSADVDKVPRQEDAEVQAVITSQTPVQDETAICEASSAEVYVEAEKAISTVVYQVDGYIPDEGLQTYLYQRLCEHGIGYFMPYAVCLIAQESTWNPMAVNPNGEDFGLLQYKIKWVPWMDWTNPYIQIDYFVAQMANRAARGLTVSQMISCHMMSDYGEYNQSYVDAVMQHSNTLVQIRGNGERG